MKNLTTLRTKVKLSFVNPDGDQDTVFGKGIAELCLGVREEGTLNGAASKMGMAYSKAWRIVKGAESNLGESLINRRGGRGSTLTDVGNELLDTYIAVTDLIEAQAQRYYDKLI